MSIDGIGENLRWTGSTRILDGRRTFAGYAINACARGETTSVTIRTPEPPGGSLSGPAAVRQFATPILRVATADAASWSLTSSLANVIYPATGFGDDDATYSATNYGTDAIALELTGRCGMMVTHSISLIVERSSDPPPPPPPTGGRLRCRDGTTSPTCTNCANKRGCCSNHGEVCGC